MKEKWDVLIGKRILISMTPPTPIRLNYVICMDEEEYAEKGILVGDVVSIDVNKKLSGEE